MALDKKAKASIPYFVLLDDIGKIHRDEGEVSSEVDAGVLDETIEWLLRAIKPTD